jgi:hypothetical protein
VHNTGTADLVVASVVLGAGSSSDFSITSGPASATLGPAGSLMVEVSYSPSGEGARSGTLRVESNDEDEPVVTVPLTGEGVRRPVPIVDAQPPSVDFGEVVVGESALAVVTIRNSGMADLEIAGVGLGAGSSPDFAVTVGPARTRLPPGEASEVEVSYTPREAESDSGTLRIESNDPDATVVVVSLSGRGVRRGTDGEDFLRGNSNSDIRVDISDGIYSFSFLFLGGPAPRCFDAADANDDGRFDISDGIYTLNNLFSGGPEIPDPGTMACGPDPTADTLTPCDYPPESCP